MTYLGSQSINLLIVDDAESDRVTYSRYLQSDAEKTYRIIEAATLEEGLELYRSQQPDIVLLDLNLPDGDGLEFLEAINGGLLPSRLAVRLPAIVLTEKGDEQRVEQAMKLGAANYLVKADINATSLSITTSQVLREADLTRQLMRSQQQQAELYQSLQELHASLEQKSKERASELIASELKYSTIFNNTFQFTGLLTPTGILIDANQSALTFAGIQLEDVINRPFWETYWWSNSPENQEQLKQGIALAAKGEFIRYEFEALGANEQIKAIDFSLRPITDEFGQVIMIIPEGRDVSDRKVAEAALLASEAKSRAILATIPDYMVIIGADGNYRQMVTPHRDFLVHSENFDLVGRAVSEVLPPEAAQQQNYYLRKAIQTGELQVYEQQIQIGDRLQYEEVRIIKCGEDEALFMIRDISDRKRAEQELQKLNQSLETKVTERTQKLWQVNQLQRAILDGTDYAIISTNLNGIIQTFNAGAEKMLGYSMGEVVGKVTPETFCDSQELSDKITKASTILGKDLGVGFGAIISMATQGLIDEEWTNIRKDGSRFPVSVSVTVLKDKNEQPIGILSVRRDISDRKQTENALRESQILLQTVLDAFPLSVFWKDRQSVYLGCNQLFANTSGIKSPLEAIGKTNFDFSYTEEEALAYLADDQQVMESGLAKLNIEETITLPSGEQRWIQTNKVPLRDLEGNVIGVMGTFQDISDRKQAEKALKESEQSYASLMAAAPVGIFRTDAMGHCTYVNDRWCRISGLTLESAKGDGWRQGLYSEDRQSITDEWYRSVQEDRPFSLEYRFQRPDGVLTWVYGQSVVKLDADGIVTGYVGTITDISDRKQAELQLQKSTDRLALALNSGAIGCWEWDIQQNIFVWDDRMFELYGYLEESYSHLPYEIWANAVHPDDRNATETLLQQAVIGIAEYDCEFRVIHPDRSIHFIKAYGKVKRDSQGNAESMIGVNFDISDRKQAEIKLQSSEDRFRRVFDSSVVGMLFAHFQGHIIDANDRFLEMLGYTREDFQTGAIDWLAMTPPEYLEKDSACMEYLIEHRQIDPWEKEYYRKDGSRISILIGAALLQGTNNETICVILDISDRKQAEIQLQTANQELLCATKLKDEFLANMSHELRTPLNAILGMSESLKEEILGSLNEKQLKAIATVESSGEHLLSLINDILDLSKISAGMMELDITSVSVKNLCSSSLVFIKQQAFQKTIQLHSHIPTHINNVNIKVDERRIKQVLINLLTNAVKFTPKGGNINLLVAIGSGDTWQGEATIPQQIRDMNSPTILFQVVDTGIGIAAKDLQMLFQPFVQVDSALNRQYEGTGLGLALVKQIIELHGGQVMAESEVGQGSRFTVALPCEMSSFNAIASTPTSKISSSPDVIPDNAPLILLAEDNEANIQTFSSYLTAINYRIIIARNGIEAIAQAKENLPDIILMDIQMPIMDGLEATKQIRLDPNLINTPIIALTALAMEGDQERCLAAGVNEYIAKPVKLRQLNLLIQKVLGSVN
jgi:PAS domain S-box-containing protein